MFAIKNILKALTLIMAIIGFIFLILLLLGYRLIIEFDTKPDWEAISSIGTILAVITALFIIKLEDLTKNKKKLKIDWLHSNKTQNKRNVFTFHYSDLRIDEIFINFTNTGNRRIIISEIYIEFQSKIRIHLLPDELVIGTEAEMKLPCLLEPEMSSHFTIPYLSFTNTVKKMIKDNQAKDNDNILLVVKDTTEKTYFYNTQIKYSTYL